MRKAMLESEMIKKVCAIMSGPPPHEAPQMGPAYVFCMGSACAHWLTHRAAGYKIKVEDLDSPRGTCGLIPGVQ
jgi:hypothetical protein